MSWTYSGDPSASEKDQVRFYLGDVDSSFPLLTDEEINFLLTQWDDAYNGPLYIAAVAAEVVAGRFAKEISVSADGVSVQISELQQRYNELANSLRDQYKALYGFFDPVTAANILNDSFDPSIKPLIFAIGFNDNYLAGRQNYGDFHPGRTTDWWSGDVQNEPVVWG